MSQLRSYLVDEVRLRLLPFAGAALVAVAYVGSPSRADGAWWSAIALSLALSLGVLLVPWRRLPDWWQVTVPLAFLALVALVRHVEGGAPSGFSPLMLLSIVWVALYCRPASLVVSLVGLAIALAAPIVMFGPPGYAAGEWRRLVITLSVGALMGAVVQHLVRQNAERARELSQQARSLEIIAATLRALPAGDDPRTSVCEAVIQVGSADGAWLLEPDGDEHLTVTAHAGQAELPALRVHLRGEPSGSAKAFTTSRTFFVADVTASSEVSQRLVKLTGIASALFEPVQRGDETIGVLMAGWVDQRDHIDDQAVATVRILAAEIPAIIERADLLAEVRRLADTDSLTGLANRRRFVEELEREIERARRGDLPTCVVMLDIDYFKRFNDEFGHLAGDDLLRRSAAEWGGAVRVIDTLARYGGEEFALLLPKCSLESALLVVDRLRGVTPPEVTLSAGVSSLIPGEKATEFLNRADEALYLAKRNGRNRVESAPVPGPVGEARGDSYETTEPGSTTVSAGRSPSDRSAR
ncbi:MAG: GGDEF domain-containing protein [Actinomycetota bacterium]